MKKTATAKPLVACTCSKCGCIGKTSMNTNHSLHDAAATLGRKGGSVKSERKTAAARANAKRPRPNRTAKSEVTRG